MSPSPLPLPVSVSFSPSPAPMSLAKKVTLRSRRKRKKRHPRSWSRTTSRLHHCHPHQVQDRRSIGESKIATPRNTLIDMSPPVDGARHEMMLIVQRKSSPYYQDLVFINNTNSLPDSSCHPTVIIGVQSSLFLLFTHAHAHAHRVTITITYVHA